MGCLYSYFGPLLIFSLPSPFYSSLMGTHLILFRPKTERSFDCFIPPFMTFPPVYHSLKTTCRWLPPRRTHLLFLSLTPSPIICPRTTTLLPQLPLPLPEIPHFFGRFSQTSTFLTIPLLLTGLPLYPPFFSHLSFLSF